MTRAEILACIERFALLNGYEVTKYAERIAEAKRRMDKGWRGCPCHRDSEHFCGSHQCEKDIKENGVCGCNLYKRVEK